MPASSVMRNQLSGLPVLSSTCSHRPIAEGCCADAARGPANKTNPRNNVLNQTGAMKPQAFELRVMRDAAHTGKILINAIKTMVISRKPPEKPRTIRLCRRDSHAGPRVDHGCGGQITVKLAAVGPPPP